MSDTFPLPQVTSLLFAGRHPVYLGIQDPALRCRFLDLLDSLPGISRRERSEESIAAFQGSRNTPQPIVILEGKLGTDRCREVRLRQPTATILILRSSHPQEPWVPWIQAGASGFLEIWSDPGSLLRAMSEALAGGLVLPAWAARELWELLPSGDPQGTLNSARLTDRQRQILRLVAQGLPSKEVAARLNLKEIHVRKSLSKIYRRLGVESRTAATAWWLEHRGGE